MAVTTISTPAPNRTPVSFRGTAPKLLEKTLKRIMCNTGLYHVYLNGAGQVMVRRETGAKYCPTFNAVSVAHAVEMAKSGQLVQAELTRPN